MLSHKDLAHFDYFANHPKAGKELPTSQTANMGNCLPLFLQPRSEHSSHSDQLTQVICIVIGHQ
jgi:hypothetical protein